MKLNNIIETERLKQSLSVYKLARLAKMQTTELNNFLKGLNQIGSNKIESLFEVLKLRVTN